jgi:hypothetical protein
MVWQPREVPCFDAKRGVSQRESHQNYKNYQFSWAGSIVGCIFYNSSLKIPDGDSSYRHLQNSFSSERYFYYNQFGHYPNDEKLWQKHANVRVEVAYCHFLNICSLSVATYSHSFDSMEPKKSQIVDTHHANYFTGSRIRIK